MSGISTTEKPEDKREKLKLMKDFHKLSFDTMGISDAVFIPKLAYKPAGKTEKHLAFFASELAKGQDIYTEFADSDYDPQDPERRLYKWRFNPNYKEEYEAVETNGAIRYYIPVAELILVKTNSPEILVEENAKGPQLKLELDETDVAFKDATIRDIAAVLWKKPVSTKKWLNDLINKA